MGATDMRQGLRVVGSTGIRKKGQMGAANAVRYGHAVSMLGGQVRAKPQLSQTDLF
jgi:hypothetical protein